MDSTNNQTNTLNTTSVVESSAVDTSVEQTPTTVPTTDDFTSVTRSKFNKMDVSANITLEQFKALLTKDKIVYYDKRGRSNEFDNEGILRRHCETIKEKNKEDEKDKPKYKFTVWMKTYLHLAGDIVIMEWFDGEVKFNTKLNHQDLKNWSGRMYWRGT